MRKGKEKKALTDKRLNRRNFLKVAGVSAAAIAGTKVSPRIGRASPTKLTKLEYCFTIAGSASAPLMGLEKGHFKKEGIELIPREFPSGTTALQSWQAGAGNVILTGDLPGMAYYCRNPEDHRLITPFMRSATYYGAVVKADIKGPKDLIGKTIATRVGSTGSYYIDRYLMLNNIDPKDVEVINLGTSHLVPAMDRGDIDGFFIWQPHVEKSLKTSGNKVRQLTDGVGYMNGYSLVATRPQWLKENKEVIHGFLRALMASVVDVEKDHELAARILNKHYGMALETGMWLLDSQFMEWLVGFDKTFYEDFTNEFRWAKKAGKVDANAKLDFNHWVYFDGLRYINPYFVKKPPKPVI